MVIHYFPLQHEELFLPLFLLWGTVYFKPLLSRHLLSSPAGSSTCLHNTISVVDIIQARYIVAPEFLSLYVSFLSRKVSFSNYLLVSVSTPQRLQRIYSGFYRQNTKVRQSQLYIFLYTPN